MNIKLISVAAALAFSAAVAQDYEDDYEEAPAAAAAESEQEAPAAPAAPAPQPAPAAQDIFAPKTEEAPDAPATNAGLAGMHGRAYNAVGNQFASATIGDDMNSLYSMAGRNLIYAEPTNEYGVLALTKGMTYLLGFDNTRSLGLFTAGIATPVFGIAVDFAFDKEWNSTETKSPLTKTTNDTTTTKVGDVINLKFGVNLGALDLTANAYWLTYNEERDSENETETVKTEVDNDFWDIGANVAISNGPSAQSLAWSIGVKFLRQKSWNKTTTAGQSVETTNPDAFMRIEPTFNLGASVLSNDFAQVMIGLNSRLPVIIYDEIEDATKEPVIKDNHNSIGFYTAPNIFGEMAINENWMVYAGATYEWKVFNREAYSTEQGPSTRDQSIITTRTNQTNATAGVRFMYKSLILEASIADNLDSQSWSGLIGNFGAFLVF